MTLSSHPTVVVRDLVRKRVHRLEPDRAGHALLVPNDFLIPAGPVALDANLIEYEQGGHVATGRTTRCSVDALRPGQRVLLQLPSEGDELWWLCEVEEVNGLAAD
jgi:hypothetical protein